MSYITLKCKNCGSQMSLNTESHSATCVHCGSTFLLSEILDEKDMAFAEKFTPKNLEKKMMAQGAIKQGETFLYQAEYDKAEASFKRAIDLDDSNYKAYLGVVKAKTHNLNIIPESDDYVQYAHYATSLANDDEIVLVKSELAKIELLRRENIRQKKVKASKKKREEQKIKQARGVSKFALIISIAILAMLTLFLFLGATFSTVVFEGVDNKLSININSYETLNKVFASDKYLNYEINITKDIDCKDNYITPLGKKNKAFTGTFNGNKHTISNLKIKAEPKTNSDIGLFGYTKLANINNVVFDNVSLVILDESENNKLSSCGLIAGTIDSTVIKNIEIKDTCSLKVLNSLINNEFYMGGVVGKAMSSSHISHISSHSQVLSDIYQSSSPINFYVGGIAGNINNSYIQNTCSNSMLISSMQCTSLSYPKAYISGIAGCINFDSASNISNIKNNFFSGLINAETNQVNCSISAVAKTYSSPTTPIDNFCLYTPTSFMHNSTYITKQSLGDYTASNSLTTLCNTNPTYLEKLNQTFSTWKNSESLTPSLI